MAFPFILGIVSRLARANQSTMKLIKPHKQQLPIEEISNALTHGLGAFFSVVGLLYIVNLALIQHDASKISAASLFGLSLVLMYSASTLYHLAKNPSLKKWLKILDHSAIYLLIAGSYAPFLLITLQEEIPWTLFYSIWALALSGITFKLFFVHRFQLLSTLVYLIMGWLALIAINPICQHLAKPGLMLLLAGGISYTTGVIFYLWKRLLFSHTIWHLFVIVGSTLHFFAIFYFVIAPTH